MKLNEHKNNALPSRAVAVGVFGQSRTETVQRKTDTGLGDKLQSGIEALSGQSMDDVKVHFNSPKPAQLQAHAFAQGTNIHLATGQEKHLPHEAWHVVQQKQGRVQPTLQMNGGINVNDNDGLEMEADAMGARALSSGQTSVSRVMLKSKAGISGTVQGFFYERCLPYV